MSWKSLIYIHKYVYVYVNVKDHKRIKFIKSIVIFVFTSLFINGFNPNTVKCFLLDKG